MQREGAPYTILFSAAVCVVCSALVCGANVLLRDRQERNRVLDRQRQVLLVAGVIGPGESVSNQRVAELFRKAMEPRLVDLKAGDFASGPGAPAVETYDPRRAKSDPALSSPAPANQARIERLPRYAVVYFRRGKEGPDEVIIPIEGKGLWSTLYGYLALDRDVRTIRGITFYEHGETPGLGGEVDNPLWKEKWKGRLAFDEQGAPRIHVKRGAAREASEEPFAVDGLTGATLTSQGVSAMLSFWLGESGLGPFLAKLRARGL